MSDPARVPQYCRNCSTPLGGMHGLSVGNFCPNCGQETSLHPPTFWEFFHEFITHYVALEGKLWKTLALLFFKPAELTREYSLGHKQRYISPLRIYITASFLFFLFVKIVGWGNTFHTEVSTGAPTKPAAGVTYSYQTDQDNKIKGMTIENVGKTKVTIGTVDCDNDDYWCNGIALPIRNRLTQKYQDKTGEEVFNIMKAGMLANVPYALFLLLPFYALLTKMLYVRRGLYFGEHMVYALHIHAFTFFVMLLKATLPRYVGDVVGILALAYYFIAMQRFFGGRWWATAIRYAFLGTVYPFVLLSATVVVLFLVLLI